MCLAKRISAFRPPGEAANGEIHGIKWLDLDGDGRIDDGEPPLAGVTVYLDLNNNGVRDTVVFGAVVATEPYDITDANGAYDFFELPANDYVVREEIAGDLTQTYPTDHLLVSTYNLHTIFEYQPDTGRADMFTTVDVGASLSGLSYSPGDERVYGVTADGRLYVIEELRGRARAVGQLGFGDIAFFPVAVGEGDVAIDANSINTSNDDFTATTYFVVGENQQFSDHVFTAQLNYGRCVDEPTDLLSCLPILSSGRDLGTPFARLGMQDLSGATVGDDGVLYVLGFRDSVIPTVAGFNFAAGGFVGPFEISVPDTGLQFGGIDIDSASGLLHGIISGTDADWHFTLNPHDSVPAIAVTKLPQRNQSDLQFIRTSAHRLFLGVDDVVGGIDQIGANFGNLGESNGSIHGVKWEDINGNGRIDSNEQLLPGWTIYIDLNNNGVLDGDEPFHVTDDDPETLRINETGRYWFTDLPPGAYTVAEVPQDGWMQNYPSRQVYLNFEDHEPGTRFVPGETFTTEGDDGQPMDVVVTPYIFSDGGQFSGYTEFDGQGISGGTGVDLQVNNVNLNFQFGPPLQGLSLLFSDQGGSVNLTINGEFRFLDDLSDTDGQTIGGALVSVQMVAGANRGVLQLSGQIESFAIGGQEFWIDRLCTHPAAIAGIPPATHTINVGFGQRVEDVNFGNMRLGEIHGRKWHDINGNSEPDENEYLAGWTIYLDLNENGRWDEGEEPSTITDERGAYWFTNLKNGTYTVGEVLQPGWEQTFPALRPSSDLFQFEDVSPNAVYNFGDQFTVLADAGAIADVTVASFVTGGGTVTTSGSVSAVGLPTAPPTQALRIGNVTADFDFEETLTGILLIYSDGGGNVNLSINGDFRNGPSFTGLNGTLVGGTLVTVNQISDNFGLLAISGEISSFAIGGQEFWIDNLAIAGQPVPGSGVHVVDVNGTIHRNIDFGNRRLLGKIHGSKFNDFDGDGVRGPNDRGILGWEVYIDTNNNGQYDEGEPLETTNRTGEYWFMNLEPGRYIVREVEQEGWTRTSPRATFIGQQYEAGDRPVAVAEGDVNEDNVIDLVVADFAGGAVQILLGLGDGTFDDPVSIPTSASPSDLTLVDLDRDDDLDIVVALSSSNELLTLFNAGDGTFTDSVAYSTGNTPAAVVSGDFDGVSGPDVAIAHLLDDTVTVFFNNGEGKFEDTQTFAAGEGPRDLVTEDFNHDGRLDLAVLARSDSDIFVLLNNDDGGVTFDLETNIPVPENSLSLTAGDFDQDGNLDFAVTSPSEGLASIHFGLSSAAGLTFSPDAVILIGTDAPLGVAAGDLDGDGLPDIVVTDGETNDARIFFSRGDRTFTPSVHHDVGAQPIQVIVSDLNDDGLLDIATADSGATDPGVTVLLQGPRDGYLVEIVGGEEYFGLDFGNFRNGRITGRKVHDPDCDGILIGTEQGLAGFTIYVDLDDDAIHDPDEPFAISDANGDYEINNVPPGTYSIREVLFDDWVQSFPVTGRHIVTISQSNQTVTDVDFANFEFTPLPDGQDWMYGFDAVDTMYGDNIVDNPCILSLGDDDHLFGNRGDDELIGQLRNDTYHFEPALDTGVETDTITELEDGGTDERWDEGIHDRLHFDGVPEKMFPGLGADEPVLIDISGASPVFTVANQVAEHVNPAVGGGTHVVVTAQADQFEFLEQMVGGGADDILIGNSRDNLLDGRNGSDIEQGAAGDDTYVFVTGNPGDNDQLIETIGSDTLDFSRIPDAVTVDLATPPIFTTAPVIARWGLPEQTVESPAPGLFENVIGTVEADTIRGSDEDNRLQGSDQNDTFYGLGGDDELIGGGEDDLYIFADGFGIDLVVEQLGGGLNDVMDFTAVTTALTFTVGTEIHVTDGVNEATHVGLEVETILGGSSLADTLVSGDGDNVWIIDGVDTGTLNGVAFSGIENLQGGTGSDLFLFLADGQLTGGIDGGANDDTFDFTQGGAVGGLIEGGLDNDTILGDDADRLWLINGADAGSAAGIGAFSGVENLGGGIGVDTFTLDGGTLAGTIDGGDNLDTFNADAVANVFTLTGQDAGTATGIGSFVSVEYLVGNSMADRFELGTGAVSGSVDGGADDDTLVAGDAPSTFTVSGPDAGVATGAALFTNIENLTGGDHGDTFALAGGTLSGSVDGMGGNDELVADNVANTFNLTGPNAGTATGVTVGFTNVENLTSGDMADTLTISGGSLAGIFVGGGDTDTLQADNVANFFGTIGPNTGFVNGLGLFVGVESLIGGSMTDQFLFFNSPFDGVIDGQGDIDTIAAFNLPTTFNVDGSDAGNVDSVTDFLSIENLQGGSADDEFHVLGGTLSGGYDGGGGLDTLFADDVASTFDITGPDSGTLDGVSFVQIENLQGGLDADQFTVNGGSLSGTADGGGGSDTLTADNVFFNLFVIDELDGGTVGTINRFASIENLVGNTLVDYFWLSEGSISGTVDGDLGANSLIGDHIPGVYLIDGPNSGQATGVGGGFTNISSIQSGTDIDEFTVTDTGSLDGAIFSSGGDDTFHVTPGAGTTLSLFGGEGADSLTVDAGAGVPTILPGMVTVAPGGAVVNYDSIETVVGICGTCIVASPVAADVGVDMDMDMDVTYSVVEGDGNDVIPRERKAIIDPSRFADPTRQWVDQLVASNRVEYATDVGHHTSSGGVDIGFPQFLRSRREQLVTRRQLKSTSGMLDRARSLAEVDRYAAMPMDQAFVDGDRDQWWREDLLSGDRESLADTASEFRDEAQNDKNAQFWANWDRDGR